MRTPRVIVFDWDDTLVDNWRSIHAGVNAALRAMGRQAWSFDEFRSRTREGASLRDIFPRIFGDRWEEARDVFYATFEAGHRETLTVLPGAEEMLATLHGTGLVLAVVSNKVGRYLRREAEHLGWDGYFHRLVGATDAVRDKPAPEPVWLALQGTVVAPENMSAADVWFVGDNESDMRCAHDAGCLPVLLRSRPPGEDEFAYCPPQRYFPHCAALARAVHELLFPKNPF
ncbi:MAG: phosphoglycolate phosphatase [Rhodospirillaceae bacterium]|nr:MAG: phosphoglycolate phosphatase [Rhodospirillaceae bacterium]